MRRFGRFLTIRGSYSALELDFRLFSVFIGVYWRKFAGSKPWLPIAFRWWGVSQI